MNQYESKRLGTYGDISDLGHLSCEGEYWAVSYAGQVFYLRGSNGLRCIAHLLRNPGQYFQAEELLSAAGVRPSGAEIDSERARLGVAKRVHAAIRRVSRHSSALADHLGFTIKTGYACAYVPHPDRPIAWML